MDKKDLKIGDVIRFHSYIWRPKDIYYLQAHGIDNITLIKIESNVNEYELYDFRDLIKEAQDNSVYYNLR